MNSTELYREDNSSNPIMVEYPDGKAWFENDVYHRIDGPAKDWYNCKEWYYKGLLHRDDDKPAVESLDGTKEWWYHGIRHREDGYPAIEDNRHKSWWVNGYLHRLGGPAIVDIYDQSDCKIWYIYDLNHRIDGPSTKCYPSCFPVCVIDSWDDEIVKTEWRLYNVIIKHEPYDVTL